MSDVTFFSLRELARRADSKPHGWLLDGVLPAAGTVLLAGAAHAGKSRLCMALAAAMQGPAMLAGRPTLIGPVIYCALERPDHEVVTVFGDAFAGAGHPSRDGIHLVRAFSIDEPAHVERVGAYAAEVGAVMVVIETLRGASAMDEVRPEQVALMRTSLPILTGDGQRLVLVQHHASKGRPRGTFEFEAQFDTTIVLNGTKDGLGATLHVRHHYGSPPFEWSIRYVHADDELGDPALRIEEASQVRAAVLATSNGHAKEDPDEELENAIVAILRDQPIETRRALGDALRARAVKAGNGKIGVALHRLRARGRLGEDGWQVVDHVVVQ